MTPVLQRPVTLSIMLIVMLVSPAWAEDAPWRGKVAVITGSSSGLGYELARLAAEKDMKLVLADINSGPSEAFARRVLAEGGQAVAVEVDLADRNQRPRVIEAALEQFGTVDYLFNNAGYAYLATLEHMDLDAAQHLFEVNYWAYVDLAQQVIPIMKAQGSGSILNVVSIMAHREAGPGSGHYAASKAALLGIFHAAAQELEADGIKVFLASPGGMRTGILHNAVGPLAEERRGGADDWEPPEVAARDIFEGLRGDAVQIYPGYVEGP